MKENLVSKLILTPAMAFAVLAGMSTAYGSNCNIEVWGNDRCAVVEGAYDIYENRGSIPYTNGAGTPNGTVCRGANIRAQSGRLSDYTAADAGTDCSGLAFYAYKQANLEFTNYGTLAETRDMIKQMIELSSQSEAKPGDLVFWAGTGTIDYTRPSDNRQFDVRHVGVYIGNDQVIDTWDCNNGPNIRNISTRYGWSNGLIGYYKHKDVNETVALPAPRFDSDGDELANLVGIKNSGQPVLIELDNAGNWSSHGILSITTPVGDGPGTVSGFASWMYKQVFSIGDWNGNGTDDLLGWTQDGRLLFLDSHVGSGWDFSVTEVHGSNPYGQPEVVDVSNYTHIATPIDWNADDIADVFATPLVVSM